jgi:hypothetical protein
VNITTRYGRITDAFYNANKDEYVSYVKKLMRRFDNIGDEIEETSQQDMFEENHDGIEAILRTYLRKESSYQYSDPASGIALPSIESLEETFDRLFEEYVNKYVKKTEKRSRNDEEIWREVFRPKIANLDKKILNRFTAKKIKTSIDELEFDYSWKNGRWHLIQPISFDLVMPGYIREKAQKFLGKNVLLNKSDEITHLYVLLGKPVDKGEDVNRSYDVAKDILSPNGFEYKYDLDIIEEDEAEDFAQYVKDEIKTESE